MSTGAILRAGLVILGLVAVAMVLLRISELLIVFLIAIVLAEGLRPLVGALERRGLHRDIARALVYLALVAILVGLILLIARPVVTQAKAILADLPRYQQDLERNVRALQDQFQLNYDLSTQASGSFGEATRTAFSLAAGLVRAVFEVVVVLLLSFLWLGSSRSFGGFLLSILPPGRRKLAASVWEEITRGFAGYVRGVGINMVVIGVVTGVAAWLLGLPAPVVLGLLAGLTEMIPIVGPIIGAIPAILLGFTISPVYPLVVALVYLAIQQVEAHTLVPLVMRQSVGVPALVVVLALAAGGALAGVGGAIVAVPVAFALQVVILRVMAPELRARMGKEHVG